MLSRGPERPLSSLLAWMVFRPLAAAGGRSECRCRPTSVALLGFTPTSGYPAIAKSVAIATGFPSRRKKSSMPAGIDRHHRIRPRTKGLSGNNFAVFRANHHTECDGYHEADEVVSGQALSPRP